MMKTKCENCHGTLSLSPDGTQLICDYCGSEFPASPLNASVSAAGRAVGTAGVDVVLTGFDPARKIKLIKAVREITGRGLADAVAAVEGTPFSVKVGISETEAIKIKQTFEANGGTVEVKKTALQ